MFNSKTTLKEKLSAYNAAAVDAAPPKNTVTKNIKSRSTLLALAPFAAGALIMPSTMNAQCGQGTAAFNSTGGSYGDGQIDVDGDGNADFDFDIAGGLFITPVGTMSVGLYTASYATFENAGGTISSNSPLAGFGGIGDFFLVSANANFNGGTGFSYFLPIRDAAGNLGFINIVTDGAGAFTIDVAETGIYEDNTTSIIAGECPEILPIELMSFQATANEKAIDLEWVTTSELENKGFEVQRSIDGINFIKIGWVDGEGSSNREVTYTFDDVSANSNTLYYYRLRQLDYDNTEFFSEMQMAEIENQNLTLKAFPNPAATNSPVQLSINANAAHQGSVQVFDITGRTVQAFDVQVVKGENTFDLAPQALNNGTYVIKIMLGEETKYQKLIVQ